MERNTILETYRWLATADGQSAVRTAREQSAAGLDINRRLKQFRKTWGATRAAAIVEQAELQQRAVEKFPQAERLLWTRVGCEQASSWNLARYKAARHLTAEPVDDFCCGVGIDLLAWAQQGPVCGWERDPLLAWIAAFNLHVVGAPGSEVRCAEVDLSGSRVRPFHADPDRRLTGRRTTRGELFSPPLEELLAAARSAPAAAIKLAPATDLSLATPASQAAPDACEREWLGAGRECKQQVLWTGEWAWTPGRRSATVVATEMPAETCTVSPSPHLQEKTTGPAHETLREHPEAAAAECCSTEWLPWLVEPHAAVRAADLVSSLVLEFGGRLLSPGHVLYGREAPLQSRLASSFRVLEVSRLRRREVESMLQRHEVGRLELKPRGLARDDKWRNFRWKSGVGKPATLFVTRRREDYLAILTHREKAHPAGAASG